MQELTLPPDVDNKLLFPRILLSADVDFNYIAPDLNYVSPLHLGIIIGLMTSIAPALA